MGSGRHPVRATTGVRNAPSHEAVTPITRIEMESKKNKKWSFSEMEKTRGKKKPRKDDNYREKPNARSIGSHLQKSPEEKNNIEVKEE